jgi:hypothetical protein
MGQGRRIFFEALVVSVLGHAIFFSVFVVKEDEPGRSPPVRQAQINIAGIETSTPVADATPASSDTEADLPSHVELHRRTTVPKLELDRTAFVLDDEPELAPLASPSVGPESWGFAKEPAPLRDEFPVDYDAGPSLAAARHGLAEGSGEPLQVRIPFTIPFKKAPTAGALTLGPEGGAGPDVKLFRGEVRLDIARGKLDYRVRPTGDPLIDAAVMSGMGRWQFKLEHTEDGYRLVARMNIPKSIGGGGPARKPLSADEVLGGGALTERAGEALS